MKFAVLGTGNVGSTIASKLVKLGHQVRMGSRESSNPNAKTWVERAGVGASSGDFADAASFGDVVFNCTAGGASIDALQAAGASALRGKVLIDVANPLDFGKGMPPTLSIFNDDSLGERIQRTFPEARVVKTLNTVNANLMVDPSRVPGDHDIFMSGDHADAKQIVRELLTSFGWRSIVDLGGIATARGPESYLPFWLRLWGAVGSPDFNIKVVRAT